MKAVPKIQVLEPKKRRNFIMAETLTGGRQFDPVDYVVRYEVPREVVMNTGWGAVNLAEYLIHLSIAGTIDPPIMAGFVLVLDDVPYMFVNQQVHGTSLMLEYMPLAAWYKFGIVRLNRGNNDNT